MGAAFGQNHLQRKVRVLVFALTILSRISTSNQMETIVKIIITVMVIPITLVIVIVEVMTSRAVTPQIFFTEPRAATGPVITRTIPACLIKKILRTLIPTLGPIKTPIWMP
jgi:hypothetical protein